MLAMQDYLQRTAVGDLADEASPGVGLPSQDTGAAAEDDAASAAAPVPTSADAMPPGPPVLLGPHSSPESLSMSAVPSMSTMGSGGGVSSSTPSTNRPGALVEAAAAEAQRRLQTAGGRFGLGRNAPHSAGGTHGDGGSGGTAASSPEHVGFKPRPSSGAPLGDHLLQGSAGSLVSSGSSERPSGGTGSGRADASSSPRQHHHATASQSSPRHAVAPRLLDLGGAEAADVAAAAAPATTTGSASSSPLRGAFTTPRRSPRPRAFATCAESSAAAVAQASMRGNVPTVGTGIEVPAALRAAWAAIAAAGRSHAVGHSHRLRPGSSGGESPLRFPKAAMPLLSPAAAPQARCSTASAVSLDDVVLASAGSFLVPGAGGSGSGDGGADAGMEHSASAAALRPLQLRGSRKSITFGSAPIGAAAGDAAAGSSVRPATANAPPIASSVPRTGRRASLPTLSTSSGLGASSARPPGFLGASERGSVLAIPFPSHESSAPPQVRGGLLKRTR